jgi:hypothetical protein
MTPTEKRYKTRGRDWWAPLPETPLNASVPYVVQIAADGFSLTQARVYDFITRPDNRLKNETGVRGFVCDPGGYTDIAKATGVCRKTVRNAIKALAEKQALREHKVIMRGGQRVKTLYFAVHFGDLLPAWRADPRLFKTNAEPARLVAIGRKKTLATIEVAKAYKIDPDRAPLRGSGSGRSGFAQTKRTAKIEATKNKSAGGMPPLPHPSDAAMYAAQEAMMQCCEPVLEDIMDLCHAVMAESRRLGGGEIPPEAIARAVMDIAREYKPVPKYPRPTPKYFIIKIPAKIAQWVKFPETRARTG